MTKKINIEELKARISYEELYELYVTQNKNKTYLCMYYSIAQKELNCLLKIYNIYKRKKRCNLDKEKLYDLYINKNLSISELMTIFKVSKSTITRNIKKYKIFKSKELITTCEKRLCLERTGYTTYSQTKETQAKMKATCLKRYGAENVYASEYGKQKIKETNLKRYGVENPSSLLEVKKKRIETNLERHGIKYYNNTEAAKQTCLKKYGVENIQQLPEVREKAKQTNLKRYGVEYCLQNKKICQKAWQTKKAHNKLNKSKQEDKIFEIIKQVYPNVLRNHKTKEYPFYCDFYIPELNLYIEYQGAWTHGKDGSNILGPYNPNNPKHQALVKKWEEKAEKIENETGKKSQYRDAIDTWTRRDPLKRQTAAANHLNWLEFFTFGAFLDWFNALPWCALYKVIFHILLPVLYIYILYK